MGKNILSPTMNTIPVTEVLANADPHKLLADPL